MPFGTKPGADGKDIDFNRVYAELLKPALEAAGCEVFRADEEQRAGDIRTDMFQELLVADLVLADLTLDNPNVWYELGIRHALRARGVLLVQGPRLSSPFDIYTDRKLRYRLKDGGPDPEFVEANKAALTTMALATLAVDAQRKVSPVYTLLPHLREPAWRDLLLQDKSEFGAAFERWDARMKVARAKCNAGDLLVLASETPTQALWLEAKRAAGNSLLQVRQFAFALEQFEDGLRVEPDDRACRSKRIVCLGRLGQHEEALEAARQFVVDRPGDAEALSLAGRVEKDRWQSRWRTSADLSPDRFRMAACLETASLEDSQALYRKAFVIDPSHHYSGINALTLLMLLRHLGGEVQQVAVDNLIGGVLWAALTAQERDTSDYWAKASYAELCLLVHSRDVVEKEFRKVATAAKRDWFALDSTRQTLTMLRDLQFRLEETSAALEILDHEIACSMPPFKPRQVLLFSGHMVDTPTRAKPRFPAAMVPRATAEIERVLDELQAGPGDLALTQGAAGGDLIFAEACARRGVRLQLLLPLPEPEFIESSIIPSSDGATWRRRFIALKERLNPPLAETPRIMTTELGPPPAGSSPFERCNLWLLYSALSYGPEKVRFVCLWDGGGSGRPGGTRHMVNEVKRRTSNVNWIDTRAL
ncbi:TRAFs-binding domain-containing protein [Hydrogenophaga pseudoflava]|uniref:TRAFs-binding domain-containing protein n=1 Tax=Hydrogenophaga pseudoflava TaxID=47421 RepID=UPI0027E3B6AE|nr:TRAFs-binding domain-containing protein [Hydrogenophaga pseudoflava]MDQ7747394.1 TRAFs-binding domain-containing protein [Hydrogenophaga pseudoflava]